MPIKTGYHSSFLPHILPIGATFFNTFRLYGSLPNNILTPFKEERDAKIKELKREKPIGFINQIKIAQKN